MSFPNLSKESGGDDAQNANMSSLNIGKEAAAIVLGNFVSEAIFRLAEDPERHKARSRLLEAAKKLVETLEEPRTALLELAKGVRYATSLAA